MVIPRIHSHHGSDQVTINYADFCYHIDHINKELHTITQGWSNVHLVDWFLMILHKIKWFQII